MKHKKTNRQPAPERAVTLRTLYRRKAAILAKAKRAHHLREKVEGKSIQDILKNKKGPSKSVMDAWCASWRRRWHQKWFLESRQTE